jgi:uncharacterized protein (TIGR02145 family)
MSRFGLFILVLLSFSSLFSQIPSYVPTNGLVGWWPFNGNANDESGNGNNGTVNGATLTSDRFGIANSSYLFDGMNDWINMPSGSSTSLNITSNFTLSFWFKTTQGTNAGLIGFGDNLNGNGGYLVAIGNGTVNNPNGKLTAMTGVNWYTGANQVIDNKWHFASVVLNLNSLTFIIDNVIDASFSGAQPPVSFNGLRAIAARNNGLAGYFNGQIDDIGTWNRALTQQEITNLYNAGPFDVSATTTTVCAGQPTTLSVQSVSGTITALNCASATNTGTLTAGTAASGVSSSIPYTGGNGGTHNGQTVTSSGVTGLTATLIAGTFASGNGGLTYSITGAPSASGTASFALNIGGQTCTLNLSVASNLSAQYPSGSVFCNGPTAIVDVTNPITGRTWMDRNLGASRAATSITDEQAYGDLYQWGRRSDGHQCRNSSITESFSSVDQPAHGKFISVINPPWDWRIIKNDNVWDGVSGVNNPCPKGYRLPTESEFNAELTSWSGDVFDSPLKLSQAGIRGDAGGTIFWVDTHGTYWGSSGSGIGSVCLTFSGNGVGSAGGEGSSRACGRSVRCIKDANQANGLINTIDCNSQSNNGSLIANTNANGVNSVISYTGGNGGSYYGQKINSTGASGLTATLSAGNFANGNGSLIFTLTGMPSTSGTASFDLNIGGQSCILSVQVGSYMPNSNCDSIIVHSSNLNYGSVIDNDGNTYKTIVIGSQEWMVENLKTSTYTNGFPISNVVDQNEWRNLTTGAWAHYNNNSQYECPYGKLYNYYAAVNVCPTGWHLPSYQEWNVLSDYLGGESVAGKKMKSTGTKFWQSPNLGATNESRFFGIPGGMRYNFGEFAYIGIGQYWWSITENSYENIWLGYLNFNNESFVKYGARRESGFSVRCLKDSIPLPQSVGALNCNNAITNWTLVEGTSTGLICEVSYIDGNGNWHNGQQVNSKGVSGLTATLDPGVFASGNGSLTYSITGTPSTSGTASFALNIGGQTCTLNLPVASNQSSQYPTGSVFCASGPTEVVDVVNPLTGKTWMDRNLGATRVATSSSDASSYGDLYQWGRGNDGHQCRNSDTSNIISSNDFPGHGEFIVTFHPEYNWQNPVNSNLWQGVNGVNNPCPTGYRIPTESEWENERLSWFSSNSAGAYATSLKLSSAGIRDYTNWAPVMDIGNSGHYWSSTYGNYLAGNNLPLVSFLCFIDSSAAIDARVSSYGCSVRCIKD